MPSLVALPIPHYVPAPETKADLDYADLAVIDLSKAKSKEGRLELAQEVRDALKDKGFFYAINHGYTFEQTQRMFDIADVPLAHVDPEEKRMYAGRMKETGSYQGYKPRQYWHIDGGVMDQLEHYNLLRDVYKRQHPQALRPFLPEIDAFAHHCHFNVLHPILRALATSLELPEETFVDMHQFDAPGETWVRFTKYFPRSEDDEMKSKNVWMKGHTDHGTITILWSQPVAALQVLAKDGTWKWIKHIENAVVINSGDALEFLSGGYFRPTIHRVMQPPLDQRNYTRLGIFYFCVTDDDVVLRPLASSPVLQRVGIHRRFNDEDAPLMETWRKSRVSTYGVSELQTGKEKGVEEQLIDGILVKHYN